MRKPTAPTSAWTSADRRLRLGSLVAALAALAFVSGCAEIECATDEDCPGDTICVGSSLCPPDVVCVWEGEPGVCRPGERVLCMGTGGHWDAQSCGHYVCGDFPECDAVVPGCDCGPDANFDRRDGCVEDPTCWGGCADDLDCAPWQSCVEEECLEEEAVLCMDSGGRWDLGACGDTVCGAPPLCRAIIPGCDCGPAANFDPTIGCVASPDCEQSCAGGVPCPPGFACDTCPSICPPGEDVVCPTVCGPAVCRPVAREDGLP